MTFDEVLEKFKAEDPKDILDALEELNQASNNAAAEAWKARTAYYANAEKKEKKVAARIKELKKQVNGYQAKIDAFKNPLISATTAGDQKELANIKDSMKALDADKVQASTEIGMLESVHIRGDEKLYNAVLDKAAEHDRLMKIYRSAKRKVYTFTIEMEEAYQKIQRETQHWNLGGGNGVDLNDISRHFHYEVYAKAEEDAAKENAARVADEEKRRHTLICDGERRPTIIGGGPR